MKNRYPVLQPCFSRETSGQLNDAQRGSDLAQCRLKGRKKCCEVVYKGHSIRGCNGAIGYAAQQNPVDTECGVLDRVKEDLEQSGTLERMIPAHCGREEDYLDRQKSIDLCEAQACIYIVKDFVLLLMASQGGLTRPRFGASVVARALHILACAVAPCERSFNDLPLISSLKPLPCMPSTTPPSACGFVVTFWNGWIR